MCFTLNKATLVSVNLFRELIQKENTFISLYNTFQGKSLLCLLRFHSVSYLANNCAYIACKPKQRGNTDTPQIALYNAFPLFNEHTLIKNIQRCLFL